MLRTLDNKRPSPEEKSIKRILKQTNTTTSELIRDFTFGNLLRKHAIKINAYIHTYINIKLI